MSLKLVNDPHKPPSTSFLSMCESFYLNRYLIFQLSKRELFGRYKGSLLGIAWSLFAPILMLTVYTFVFSVIFESRWGLNQDRYIFAFTVFVGMIVLNFFSEVLNKAPFLIIENLNYVKRIIFPLEVLPIVTISSAIINFLINFSVLIMANLLVYGFLNWTIFFAPIVIFPLIVLTLGLGWILAALGVYARDIGQSISLITSILLFLSPIFYPISAIPKQYQSLIMANPLTFIIEQLREVVIWGHHPNWLGLLNYCLISLFIAWLGFVLFQKTKKGFADVL